MVIQHTNIFHPRALQIYPIWDFWYENKPSGNPECDQIGRNFVNLEKNKFVNISTAGLKMAKFCQMVKTLPQTYWCIYSWS
jgi:hypothetical protein